MKLYQVEHDNCEPYEDNFHFREDKVYTDKDNLIKRIKDHGYKEETSHRGEQEFIKEALGEYELERDLVTIHELEVIDNREDV
ncbi:hypothetical protein LCFBJUUZ_CDS0095 [Staphylococcus phage PG-2021_76]